MCIMKSIVRQKSEPKPLCTIIIQVTRYPYNTRMIVVDKHCKRAGKIHSMWYGSSNKSLTFTSRTTACLYTQSQGRNLIFITHSVQNRTSQYPAPSPSCIAKVKTCQEPKYPTPHWKIEITVQIHWWFNTNNISCANWRLAMAFGQIDVQHSVT